MGVWCDPVRNQFGENGCDYESADSIARQQKEFRWIAVAMKIAIAAAIQRWLNSCLDFGLLMGVAITMLR
jgi:hypothetical protein